MIYINIINDQLNRLEKISNTLLDNLNKTPSLIISKDISLLELHIEKQNDVFKEYQKEINELANIISATKHRNLSDLVSSSDSEELLEKYKSFRILNYNIAKQTVFTRDLLNDCKRINDVQLNIILSKEQSPTSYDFSDTSVNQHLFFKYKNNKR